MSSKHFNNIERFLSSSHPHDQIRLRLVFTDSLAIRALICRTVYVIFTIKRLCRAKTLMTVIAYIGASHNFSFFSFFLSSSSFFLYECIVQLDAYYHGMSVTMPISTYFFSDCPIISRCGILFQYSTM